MTPYHVDLYLARESTFVGLFYKNDEEFALVLRDESGKKHDGGSWQSISEADAWAKLLASDLAGEAIKTDPLAQYRGANYLLIVMIDRMAKKWSVVAGNRKNGRYEDTGLRFDTQEEARGAIDDR